MQSISFGIPLSVPQGFTPVSDEEFNTYGYVAEVYSRSTHEDTRLGGAHTCEQTEILIIPHQGIPPKKTLVGEMVTTNYYYEPVSSGDKERIRTARLVLSGVSPEITGTASTALTSTFVLPHILQSEDDIDIFEKILIVQDLDEEDVVEFVNLHFVGCPSIEMAVCDGSEAILVGAKNGVIDALSILFKGSIDAK